MVELDLETKRKIFRELGQAVLEDTHKYAVAVYDYESDELGSGILVQVGTHVFVATAGHVIPCEPHGRSILLGKIPRKLGGYAPGILEHGDIDANGIDVGFLEIDPNSVNEMLGKDILPLDRLADLRTGNPAMFSALTGFPTEKVPNPIKTGAILPRYWSIATLPIPPEKYDAIVCPTCPGEYQPEPSKNVFLEYEQGDARRLDTYEKADFPAAKGMIGGGYFDFGYVANEIWDPGKIRLYAIQASWCKRDNNPYTKGTQIIHWIKLVHDRYPDVADMLVERFPRIEQL